MEEDEPQNHFGFLFLEARGGVWEKDDVVRLTGGPQNQLGMSLAYLGGGRGLVQWRGDLHRLLCLAHLETGIGQATGRSDAPDPEY